MALKVLVVDDDFINRKLIQTLLKKNPKVTEIVEAENGSDALDKMMPVVDGIEFLKIFRSDMSNAHVPVIVLSTDDTRKTEVFNNGANDFLRKPIMQDNLYEKINQWTD